MNQQPRRLLRQLIARYGTELHRDPKRTEAFLQDLCGQHQREIFVLVHAQRQRVPHELLFASEWRGERVLRQRLSRRLQNNLAFTEEAADWAVESWALALDVVPARERRPWLWKEIARRSRQLRKGGYGKTVSPVVEFLGRTFAEIGVQLWKRLSSLLRHTPLPAQMERSRRWVGELVHRRRNRIVAAAVLLIVAIATVVAIQPQAAARLGRNLGFWPQDDPEAARQVASDLSQAVRALHTRYVVPRDAWLDADLLYVRQEPDEAVEIAGYIGPLGAKVTVDALSDDGHWSHVSTPVTGWISNRFVLFRPDFGGKPAGQGSDNEMLRVRLGTGSAIVTASRLRVRAGPGIDFPISENLRADQSLTLIATTENGTWVQIATPIQGWVSAEFIAIEGKNSER